LYTDEIFGDQQCGFQCNRSTTVQIFCICQVLENKWEYNQTVHQVFVDFKKVFDSVRKEVLYIILIEFGVRIKFVSEIKICSNETYSEDHIGKHLCDSFPNQNGRKQEDALLLLLFNCAVEYAIRKVCENQVGVKLNGTHQLLAYTDDVNLLGDNIVTTEKNTETIIGAGKEVVLEINLEKLNKCSYLFTRMLGTIVT
jgi:hypothetical protein